MRRFTVKLSERWLAEYSEWASAMTKSFGACFESAFLRRFASFQPRYSPRNGVQFPRIRDPFCCHEEVTTQENSSATSISTFRISWSKQNFPLIGCLVDFYIINPYTRKFREKLAVDNFDAFFMLRIRVYNISRCHVSSLRGLDSLESRKKATVAPSKRSSQLSRTSASTANFLHPRQNRYCIVSIFGILSPW